MHPKFAIIVAGGSGTRMGAGTPKQFLLLANKPILVHTIERFLEISNISIVLVLPKEYFSEWDKISRIYFSENSQCSGWRKDSFCLGEQRFKFY
jgi:2-C-methyl-D-erythritol 4-phosphate cytidylyltransferase